MNDLATLSDELRAQQDDLDEIVEALAASQWSLPTPSPGWTIADQIGHLSYFDGSAAQAINDPDGFAAGVEELFASVATIGPDEFTLASYRAMDPDELLASWRENRLLLAEAATRLAEGARVPWYGPSMGAKSFLTARLMEVWAHGTDIADSVGSRLDATDRLRHIVQLGVITRGWSYSVRGLEIPSGTVAVELEGPGGDLWTYGDPTSAESVRGPAEDFCLVVTQRRNLEDTHLEVTPLARDWLLRAQAFAGAPTEGPAPRGDS